MKLVIQIPCLNEAATLPQTLREIPRQVQGFDHVEILVIDDGSSDGTADIARQHGADHVLSLGSNRGLGKAFLRGIETAVALGADAVVNTDADNQYCAADIPKLVAPILANQADLVIGCRPILQHQEFGPIKKLLQLAGSWALRQLSKTNVRDAASGFRAFSREACLRLFVYSSFSYCMETLIQAGNIGLRVASVDIRVNPSTRPSRLFRSIPEYIWRSGLTILAMFLLYRPGRFFFWLSSFFFAGALFLGLRFLYLVYLDGQNEPGRTYLPSLVLLSILAVTAVLTAMLGILAELTRAQRRLTEEILYLERRRRAS